MKTHRFLVFFVVVFTVAIQTTSPLQAGLVISSATASNGEPEGIAFTGNVLNPHADADVPSPYTVPTFGEEAACFTDRDHQYNGATGDGLPDFLVGGDYVMTANDARDNGGFVLAITTATNSRLYVLKDNRFQPPAWFSDGQGLDFTDTGFDVGIDESGFANNTTNPGEGINQTSSIFIANDTSAGAATVLPAGVYLFFQSESTGGNMYGVVAVKVDLTVPLRDFYVEPQTISHGESATLHWTIAANADSAEIDNGVGDILPFTDATGGGAIDVTPDVTTNYTLSVSAPGGNDTAEATVTVRLIESFTGAPQIQAAGSAVVLRWQLRPDASVSISPIGDVTANTNTNGVGSVVVYPETSVAYTLTASAGAEQEETSVRISVVPAGERFALIDIGLDSGQPEPGAATNKRGNQQIGLSTANGANLATTNLFTDTGGTFTIAIDNLDPSGATVGGIDWRDRGDAGAEPLTRLAEDFCKNNAGMLRVTLGSLPAGIYNIVSYHIDPDNSQSEAIKVWVTDANGTAVAQSGIGDASYPGHPANGNAPDVAGLTEALVAEHFNSFRVQSDGVNDVIIYFDAQDAPLDDESPLNGLEILRVGEDNGTLVIIR